jgi:3-(3-hydroxy-phenyl)propionate hydroxylase
MQQAVLSLSMNHEFPRELLHWRTSHPMDYANSRLTWVDETERHFNAGPGPGAPARNAKLSTGGFLLNTFQSVFQVMVFGTDEVTWQSARADVMQLRGRGLRVQLMSIRNDDVLPEGADVPLRDADAHVEKLWGAEGGAVYVLRPDQHVCARWKPNSKARVLNVIDRIFSPATSISNI